MSTVTDHWLANILMSPPPRPTAFDVVPGTSRSQVAEPIPYLLPKSEQPAYLRRIADALVRGQSQQYALQPIDEALAAQQAREAFTARTRQSVQPEGGRKEGALTDLFVDSSIPQSPTDYAALLLAGRFRPFVKAGALGLGLAMESSPAEANALRRLVTRFPQFAERYPAIGAPTRAIDPGTGKEYWARTRTPEVEELHRARTAITNDMRQGGYESFFDPVKRFHVDPGQYPPNVDTRAIVPTRQATVDKNMQDIGGEKARGRLRAAYEHGSGMPNTSDWYAVGQLEKEFIDRLGREGGRKAFRDRFATSMAATTAGAEPGANLLMSQYGNYLRHNNLRYPAAGYEMPYPIGGRYAASNMKTHHDIFDAGGWSALGVQNPKRHNFAQNFMGNRNTVTIDEQMTSGMTPSVKAPARGQYGLYERVLQEEAARVGVSPSNFQEVAWAGFKNLKDPRYQSGKPMISYVNDSIERTHRLTGMPRDEIIRRGLVLGQIPLYGMAGLAVLPDFQPGGAERRQPPTHPGRAPQ